MNKTKIMRNYVNFSIIIGLYLLLEMFLYTARFGSEFNGMITVELFNINFETTAGITSIFNMPLLAALLFLVFNVLMYFLVGRDEDVQHQALKEVSIYNALFTLMIIVSQVVFVYSVPDRVGGLIENNYLFIDFYSAGEVSARAFNLNFLLALSYIIYNMIVSVLTIPPKEENNVVEEDEELKEEELLRQFLRED